jgi:hypothetical protein
VLCDQQITGDDPMPHLHASFLEQNHPNPFNPSTEIGFGVASPAHVSLAIYDPAGRLVRVLVDERRPSGYYIEAWNGQDCEGRSIASGVYFYRLIAGDFVQTRKMVLLR